MGSNPVTRTTNKKDIIVDVFEENRQKDLDLAFKVVATVDPDIANELYQDDPGELLVILDVIRQIFIDNPITK